MFQSVTPGDSLRYFLKGDIPRAVEIGKACFHNAPNAKFFTEYLKRDDTIGWVVERDGVVIAYCFAQLTERAINILQMAVAPTAWRTKAGEAMVNYLKEKMRKNGRKCVAAFVSDEALRAQLFFKWMGFVTATEVFDNYPAEGQLLMVYPAPPGCWKNRVAHYFNQK